MWLEWDKSALLWINSHHHPLLDAILFPISFAGEVGAIWIITCLALLIFGKPEHRKIALILGLTLIFVDRCITAPLGMMFPRDRPYLALEGIRQMGIAWKFSSFPSGHAHSVWLGAIILGHRWPRLFFPLVAFAILTCYSRPYFGMHYPLDVLGGALIGIAAGCIVIGIRSLRLRARNARRATTFETRPVS